MRTRSCEAKKTVRNNVFIYVCKLTIILGVESEKISFFMIPMKWKTNALKPNSNSPPIGLLLGLLSTKLQKNV